MDEESEDVLCVEVDSKETGNYIYLLLFEY